MLLGVVVSSMIFLACPLSIRDSQSVEVVEGWDIGIAGSERALDYVEIYKGHPERRESLRPQEEQGGSFVWKLGQGETWVVCRYHNSAATLSKNIGVVESCRFSKSMSEMGQVAKAECIR